MRTGSRVVALALLSLVATNSSPATWIAEPGTVKVLVRKKPAFRGAGGFPSDILDLELKNLGARLVDNQDSFLLVQVPSASASPKILSDFADLAVVREDFDLLQFNEALIDARMPASLYPLDWEKPAAAPFPQREAFVIQFATVPQPAWLSDMAARGVTVLDYLPTNGYLVLMDVKTAQDIAEKLPVQFLGIHQPFHRASKAVRDTKADFVDVVISIANVPEAADAIGLFAGKAAKELRPPEDGGDRVYYRVSIDQKILQPLAALPAVISIDPFTSPTPSGEREAHLTLGDTLVSNPAGVLRPVLGDQRQWFVGKGVATYKAVKVAILDTGFDIGSSTNVHPDFKNSSGSSFVTVKNYTNTPGSDADCSGHGTFVAGVLSGNAGAANSTQVKDTGATHGDANFFMGLGITPELPLVVGRIWNMLFTTGSAPIFDPQDLRAVHRDLASMGVSIVSNSYNTDTQTGYTVEAQMQDKLVRSLDNGGPSGMTIYFSSGNAEGGHQNQHFISPPATAKNVISVGGSENFNPNPYTEVPIAPLSTGGTFADNGNDIWTVASHGPTVGDHRIKPDLVAPASGIESALTRDTSSGCRAGQIGTLIDPASAVGQQHWWSRGTSFSAPLAAGAGALLYTWFKNTTGVAPKPSLLKAMQITLASDLTGTGHPPDDFQGWGKVDLTRAFLTSDHYVSINEDTNMLFTALGPPVTLPSPSTAYRVKDTSKPVRVTLVWTDAPGSTTMGPALTNDLDLTVRMKGAGIGRYALGDDFNSATGHSNVRMSGGVPNIVDNVEQVIFTSAEAGTDHFQVEVLAQRLAGDAINVWDSVFVRNQQDFSLFIENAEPYQNNSVVTAQVAPTTVQAGAPFAGSFTLMNTGNSSWTEGPNFYRLGSVAAGNPFGGRLFLAPGEVINPGSSKTFTLNATAPYAAGTYPFGWQMVEEYVAFFGAATSSVVSVAVTPTSSAFYTLTPCRVVDTRNPAGLYGGPALAPGQQRAFPLRNQCGIPATAKAVSANLTAVGPLGNGYVLAYPANIAQPLISTLSYKTGVSRANNAILTLDTDGNVICAASVAVTDFVLDVNGYFQ